MDDYAKLKAKSRRELESKRRRLEDEARRRGVEVIVMGGEPPTRMRGGAVLGGVGGSRPPEVGEVTEYVLKKAPCPVLVTAPARGLGSA